MALSSWGADSRPLTIKRFVTTLLKQGLLLSGLLLAAGLTALLTMRAVLATREVIVPTLSGLAVGEAGELAARQRLRVKVEGQRHDARTPHGRVVGQEPAPGARLKTSRSVRVWLSLGPKRITVPRVEGESVRTARLKLEQADVPLAHVVWVDHPAAHGTVLVQRPPPGQTEELPEGAAVLVSRGPEHLDYVMPDLIGRPADQVLASLQLAGLKVADLRYRHYPGIQPGVVLRQSPAAGHRVSPRTTVSLDVSEYI